MLQCIYLVFSCKLRSNVITFFLSESENSFLFAISPFYSAAVCASQISRAKKNFHSQKNHFNSFFSPCDKRQRLNSWHSAFNYSLHGWNICASDTAELDLLVERLVARYVENGQTSERERADKIKNNFQASTKMDDYISAPDRLFFRWSSWWHESWQFSGNDWNV